MGMTLVETVTVGSGGAASIEFTSIPQDGVDLLLLGSMQRSSLSNLQRLQFNNDTGGNYSEIRLDGNGSSAGSGSSSGATYLNVYASRSGDPGNPFGNFAIYVSNYTSSSDKSISIDTVAEANATQAWQFLVAGKYATSSPITSAKFILATSEFSTASLYKITAD